MKKKALTLLLAVVMIMTVAISAFPASATEASGNTFSWDDYATKTDFEISTAEDLINFLTGVSLDRNFVGKTVKLTKDIVLNDTSSDNWYDNENAYVFTGKTGYRFAGTFDGQGYEIKGLIIRNTFKSTGEAWQRSSGLFSCVEKGAVVIKNFTLNGFYVESDGLQSTAAVVGRADGALTLSGVKVKNGIVKATNCSAVRDPNSEPYAGVGSLVGQYKVTTASEKCYLTDCTVEKSVYVESDGSAKVGGICGVTIAQAYFWYVFTGSRVQPLTSGGGILLLLARFTFSVPLISDYGMV